ncbi:MAG TPA: hypothetical protein VHD88_03415 [Pyrinomonadaceae bacterium]|nr:hypothetical protein [Pyrinomonadaceae bacterium]
MTHTFLLLLLATYPSVIAQDHTYPRDIRGYKVERTVVEVKKSRNTQANSESDVDALITFGAPQLARITPLGITFEVPIIVAPVKQSGRVDFLLFEDIIVNGTSVDIDEYRRAFDLPNKRELTLREPLRFYIYLPSAVLAAVDAWRNSKETWPVTGRVYVFGKFKKGLFSFKRCVPVELNLTMRNPLQNREQ